MNTQQISSAVRIIIVALLALVPKLVPADRVGDVASDVTNALLAVGTLIMLFWGWNSNKRDNLISGVADMREVKHVVADPAIADGTLATNPKVVSPK